MRFLAVLNKDGGTLKTTDLDSFSETMRVALEERGHDLQIKVVDGGSVVEALQKAAAVSNVDVVLAGGGDGTVSAAAAALMNKGKALAILPAGTMNLFARSLGIPLQLERAVSAFADGRVRRVDMATANGRPFVHQFSIGMHAKMVKLRSEMDFGSRLGKLRASARAAVSTFLDPPKMKVRIEMTETEIDVVTTGIGVTNNLFGEGHLPYADNPDGGVLGVYVTVAKRRSELLGFFVNMARGRWRDNDHVEVHQAGELVLRIRSRRARHHCVIDGELCPLAAETRIAIHPGALRVLAPDEISRN